MTSDCAGSRFTRPRNPEHESFRPFGTQREQGEGVPSRAIALRDHVLSNRLDNPVSASSLKNMARCCG